MAYAILFLQGECLNFACAGRDAVPAPKRVADRGGGGGGREWGTPTLQYLVCFLPELFDQVSRHEKIGSKGWCL